MVALDIFSEIFSETNFGNKKQISNSLPGLYDEWNTFGFGVKTSTLSSENSDKKAVVQRLLNPDNNKKNDGKKNLEQPTTTSSPIKKKL